MAAGPVVSDPSVVKFVGVLFTNSATWERSIPLGTRLPDRWEAPDGSDANPHISQSTHYTTEYSTLEMVYHLNFVHYINFKIVNCNQIYLHNSNLESWKQGGKGVVDYPPRPSKDGLSTENSSMTWHSSLLEKYCWRGRKALSWR